MAALIDTNILVYRFDERFPEKQERSDALLREGIQRGTIRVAHQAVVEFLAATTRPQREGPPILDSDVARVETEDLLRQFEIVYPNERVVRSALQGMATYGLSWWHAHMWASRRSTRSACSTRRTSSMSDGMGACWC